MKIYRVVVEKTPDGVFIGVVPELPGCHTQADTLEELDYYIKDAIKLYLEVTEPHRHVEFGVKFDPYEITAVKT
ncbi:MAG: type II toxin-antitoxin system HicB family antitoxin [Candidatus Nanoarchaeia archaeon]